MKIKNILNTLAILLSSSLIVHAADEGLLTLLTKKGHTAQNDISGVLKDISRGPSKVEMEKKAPLDSKLTISGTLQGQWNNLDSDRHHRNNSFEMRRAQIAALADLSNDWEGKIVADLANDNHYVDEAYISKKLGHHMKGYVGYMKAPFSYEETIAPTVSKTIEPSALNEFFINDLNWGARVTGVQLQQKQCPTAPFSYSLAITNIEQYHISGSSEYNSLAYWGRLAHNKTLDDGSILTIGADLAWLPEDAVLQSGSSSASRGSDALPHALYANIDANPVSLMVQYMGAITEDASASSGVASSDDAYPHGITITPSVKITPELEGVFSYSYVDSDGIGVSPADATRTSNVPTTENWETYHQIYIGGNYYIHDDDVKFSMGFIYAKGDDMLSGDHGTPAGSSDTIDIHGLQARLQLLF